MRLRKAVNAMDDAARRAMAVNQVLPRCSVSMPVRMN
jgi:hypothetical protein